MSFDIVPSFTKVTVSPSLQVSETIIDRVNFVLNRVLAEEISVKNYHTHAHTHKRLRMRPL